MYGIITDGQNNKIRNTFKIGYGKRINFTKLRRILNGLEDLKFFFSFFITRNCTIIECANFAYIKSSDLIVDNAVAIDGKGRIGLFLLIFSIYILTDVNTYVWPPGHACASFPRWEIAFRKSIFNLRTRTLSNGRRPYTSIYARVCRGALFT